MRRTTAIALLVALLAGLVGIVLMPRVPRLGPQVTGDPDLAGTVRAAVPDPKGHRGLAVALVENGRTRVAGLGDRDGAGRPVEPGTPFEIGSVPKTFTGMLLADQVAAGVVGPDDRLGATWPAVTGPARDVTLAELASHRAGLPRLAPGSPLGWARILWSNVSGGDPYAGQDVDSVRTAADRVTPGDGRGSVHYSNLGPSVLGQALAAKAGVAYPDLLQARLLRPLGMTATVVATGSGDLPADRAQGSRASGRALDPWLGPGYAPAGIGVWSTAEDLARLVAATAGGTAPGADAATARYRENADTRIGYGWFTTRHGDREIVWHNGAAGGFRSYVGFEPATGRAVVVLGNTDKGVEPIGLRLLGVPKEKAGEAAPVTPWWIGAGLAVAFTFLGGLALLGTVRRPNLDRVTLVSAAVWAFAYLGLGHRLGDWSMVPAWLWPVGAGLSAAGVALAVIRWPTLPAVDAAVPWRRMLSVASSLAAAAVAVAAVAA
ncbi:class A beta-lactamase-related serine hydrolase [Micromonospora sp. BL4]|uniref:serine hydrolase domain-containing protein n=1 Tax=Micromonospora sp. BL4 TaxID=2478710 RepID=UPI000EF6106E|nr:serine hydrolase domain-containing protein [Micromonospora sp. BL4]RLP84857.1 class A beta-lactamase-related serine hydrolase [Micromonospora sp. BL4]